MTHEIEPQKQQVHDFWNQESCGERYGSSDTAYYETHGEKRYQLEPYIRTFASFADGSGKDVLEIGVGMGADFEQWAKSTPQSLTGVDLTERAIDHVRNRIQLEDNDSRITLRVADAEALPFDDKSFDIVYSWGVLHHSPDTQKAVREVHRVLKTDGVARIMVYSHWSLTGLMLWARYGLLRGRPLMSLTQVYDQYLESPGTKAYTPSEARHLFQEFSHVSVDKRLSPGDMLESGTGARHKGLLLTLAKRLWPRFIFRMLCQNLGLYLLIEAQK